MSERIVLAYSVSTLLGSNTLVGAEPSVSGFLSPRYRRPQIWLPFWVPEMFCYKTSSLGLATDLSFNRDEKCQFHPRSLSHLRVYFFGKKRKEWNELSLQLIMLSCELAEGIYIWHQEGLQCLSNDSYLTCSKHCAQRKVDVIFV